MFVRGIPEIQNRLSQIEKKLANRSINRANRAAADPLVAAAKSRAPIGASGALRRNIVKQKWRSKFFASVYSVGLEHGPIPKVKLDGNFGVFQTGRDKAGNRIFDVRKLTKRERRGSDPFYFHFVELGFRHYKSGEMVSPKPFLEPSLQPASGRVIDIYTNVLRKEIF